MPARAQASTSGSPWRAYGPTVVTTTRVAAARAASDAGSVASASSNGQVRPAAGNPSRTAASLSRDRPASAIRVPGGACSARCAAVNAPTNPVAPYTTTSNAR